jgi:hypothetical protein
MNQHTLSLISDITDQDAHAIGFCDSSNMVCSGDGTSGRRSLMVIGEAFPGEKSAASL